MGLVLGAARVAHAPGLEHERGASGGGGAASSRSSVWNMSPPRTALRIIAAAPGEGVGSGPRLATSIVLAR
jgi:hypothetical protein